MNSDLNEKRPRDYTVAELRTMFQKPKEQEELVAWYFTRRISVYVTRALLKTSVNANQVTTVMLGAFVLGGVLLALPSFWMRLLGVVVFHIAYLLDCVDGEVARGRKETSPEGMLLDAIGHYIWDMFMFMGFGYGLFVLTGNHLWSLLGFAAAMGAVANRGVTDLVPKQMLKQCLSNGFPNLEKYRARFKKAPHQAPPRFLLDGPYPDKTFFQRRVMNFFRFRPYLGIMFNAPLTMNVLGLFILGDVFLAYTGIGDPFFFEKLLVIYFGVALPLAFVVRMHSVFRHQFARRWIEPFKADKKK